MKVEIDDRPSTNQHPLGTCVIRLMPETNKEMAQLERCLTVNVQFEKFRKWANPDQVYYGFYGNYGSSSGEPTVISSTVKTFNQTQPEPRKPREGWIHAFRLHESKLELQNHLGGLNDPIFVREVLE